MKNYKNYIILTIIYVLAYIGLPLIIKLTQELTDAMFAILLIIYPILTFVVSAIFSKKSFDFISGLIPAIIFLVTLIIFLNESAWVYCVGYFLFAILGNYLGYKIKKKKI
jgi:drug/metabolite transporter (DMT)-like permease